MSEPTDIYSGYSLFNLILASSKAISKKGFTHKDPAVSTAELQDLWVILSLEIA